MYYAKKLYKNFIFHGCITDPETVVKSFEKDCTEMKPVYIGNNGKNRIYINFASVADNSTMVFYELPIDYFSKTGKDFPIVYDKIIKITVELSNNGRKIEYFIDTKNGTRECYTEKTVPSSVVELMNRLQCSYHEKKHNGKELFVYRP